MKKRFDAVHLALVATLIWDAHVARRRKVKFNALLEENEILWLAVDKTRKQAEYLLAKMEENEVSLTEFDKIELFNLS
jgi:hypothetical protein